MGPDPIMDATIEGMADEIARLRQAAEIRAGWVAALKTLIRDTLADELDGAREWTHPDPIGATHRLRHGLMMQDGRELAAKNILRGSL